MANDFQRDITKWVKKTKLAGHTVLRKLGFDAYTGVLLRSPVRTGRFRASNRISVNTRDLTVEPLRKELQRERYGTAADGGEVAKALGAIATATWLDTIHITNNLIYARKLEHGSSKQNGNAIDGIYGATFAELIANLDKAIVAAKATVI